MGQSAPQIDATRELAAVGGAAWRGVDGAGTSSAPVRCSMPRPLEAVGTVCRHKPASPSCVGGSPAANSYGGGRSRPHRCR